MTPPYSPTRKGQPGISEFGFGSASVFPWRSVGQSSVQWAPYGNRWTGSRLEVTGLRCNQCHCSVEARFQILLLSVLVHFVHCLLELLVWCHAATLRFVFSGYRLSNPVVNGWRSAGTSFSDQHHRVRGLSSIGFVQATFSQVYIL